MSRLTCKDKYSSEAFEKRYPNLCTEVKYFTDINGCNQNEIWVAREVSKNESRRKLFEDDIFR